MKELSTFNVNAGADQVRAEVEAAAEQFFQQFCPATIEQSIIDVVRKSSAAGIKINASYEDISFTALKSSPAYAELVMQLESFTGIQKVDLSYISSDRLELSILLNDYIKALSDKENGRLLEAFPELRDKYAGRQKSGVLGFLSRFVFGRSVKEPLAALESVNRKSKGRFEGLSLELDDLVAIKNEAYSARFAEVLQPGLIMEGVRSLVRKRVEGGKDLSSFCGSFLIDPGRDLKDTSVDCRYITDLKISLLSNPDISAVDISHDKIVEPDYDDYITTWTGKIKVSVSFDTTQKHTSELDYKRAEAVIQAGKRGFISELEAEITTFKRAASCLDGFDPDLERLDALLPRLRKHLVKGDLMGSNEDFRRAKIFLRRLSRNVAEEADADVRDVEATADLYKLYDNVIVNLETGIDRIVMNKLESGRLERQLLAEQMGVSLPGLEAPR